MTDEIKALKDKNEMLLVSLKLAIDSGTRFKDEIHELEIQIDKMKCCENCYYRNYIEEDDRVFCNK